MLTDRLCIDLIFIMTGLKPSDMHVIRASLLGHFVSGFRAMGAPVRQLLDSAGISPELLEFPEALVPLSHAFSFAELSCTAIGTEHPALELGLHSCLSDFGGYGDRLSRAPTVGTYLREGVKFYNGLNSGERLWLSQHSGNVRLNIASPGDNDLGAHQSHLCTLAVTIRVISQATGHAWSPAAIGIAYQPREPLPRHGLLNDTKLRTGLGHSYLEVPPELLALPLPADARNRARHRPGTDAALPTDLDEIVLNQIDTLTGNCAAPRIDTIANSLGLNVRTLQRRLSRHGASYGELVRQSRLRRACGWLETSDKPVTDIAFELGYSDAANFTRAFRKLTGLSPRAYRHRAQPG